VATEMNPKVVELTSDQLRLLAEAAWEVRESAYTFGHTKVGAAALSADGEIFIGCNVEHRFRSHDVHAEVNAITSMITSGRTGLVAVMIAAERERFTPCGSCMDWIYQFGGPSCRVGYQSNPRGKITILSAEELMPYYPM
jgi:cytidine deaminase